jgi:hypothetical protein
VSRYWGRPPLFSIIWGLYFSRGVSRYLFNWLALVSDGDATYWVDVLTGLVDSSMSDNGADHGVTGDCHVCGTFDQAFQSRPEVAAAAVPKADGVSVAVDGASIAELVLFSDIAGAAPVKELLLDVSAITVAADDAVGLVMVQADPARASRRRRSGALPIPVFSVHKS